MKSFKQWLNSSFKCCGCSVPHCYNPPSSSLPPGKRILQQGRDEIWYLTRGGWQTPHLTIFTPQGNLLVSITDFYQIQSTSNVAELERKTKPKKPHTTQTKNPTLLHDDNKAFNKLKIKVFQRTAVGTDIHKYYYSLGEGWDLHRVIHKLTLNFQHFKVRPKIERFENWGERKKRKRRVSNE